MNRGDWIQFLIIITLFFLVAFVVFSIMRFAWYITVLEIIVIGAGGFLLNKYIKL